MDDSLGTYGFCPACECNVRAERVDFGIGVCEYWGARSANSDWRNICPVCMGDVSPLQCDDDEYDGALNDMDTEDKFAEEQSALTTPPKIARGPIYQIGANAGGGIAWWDVDKDRYEREKKTGYMKTGIVYREES